MTPQIGWHTYILTTGPINSGKPSKQPSGFFAKAMVPGQSATA
jgi:hypothetical protein